MARTFFQDFTKDNGMAVTVEYSATGGEPICILSSWPNTQQYNDAFSRRQELEARAHLDPFRTNDEIRDVLAELSADLARDEEAAELTNEERERMETWLAEHHEDEPDYDDWF